VVSEGEKGNCKSLANKKVVFFPVIVICSVWGSICIHVLCNIYVSLSVLGYFSVQHDNENREQQCQLLCNLSEYLPLVMIKSLSTF